MYESLRKLMVESVGEEGREKMANLGLTFQVLYCTLLYCTVPCYTVPYCIIPYYTMQVTLRPEEGGEGFELVPGGATQPVTPDNVFQYVKLYSELRMVRVCLEALQVRNMWLFYI